MSSVSRGWLINAAHAYLKKNLEVQPPLQMWFIHMFKKVLDSNKYQGKPLQWPFPNGTMITMNWHQGWDSRSKSPTKCRVMFQCSPREFIQHIIELKTLLCFGECSNSKSFGYDITVPSNPRYPCVNGVNILWPIQAFLKLHHQSPIAPTAGSWKSPKNSQRRVVDPLVPSLCPRHSCWFPQSMAMDVPPAYITNMLR